MSRSIACLDVGFSNLGFALWDVDSCGFLDLRCLVTTPKRDNFHYALEDTVRRCRSLARRLRYLLDFYKPEWALAEFPHGGGQSAHAVAQMSMATGIVAATVAVSNVKLYPFHPNATKSLMGKGAASSKRNIIKRMVAQYRDPYTGDRTHLSKDPRREHIADAMILIDVMRSLLDRASTGDVWAKTQLQTHGFTKNMLAPSK